MGKTGEGIGGAREWGGGMQRGRGGSLWKMIYLPWNLGDGGGNGSGIPREPQLQTTAQNSTLGKGHGS